MNRKKKNSAVGSPYYVWMIIFIFVPLVMVAYYSFTDQNGSFTLENIANLGAYADTFVLSIALGAAATLISLIIAYPLAFIISRTKASTQKMMIMLVMLPMWMNLLLRTYSWMTIIEDTGIINTLLGKIGISPIHFINTAGSVIMGMVYNFLPYMILPLYSAMTKIDRSILEAAEDLGADIFHKVTKVIFPLSVPGVVSGITMVFVPSVSTFYISQKLGGANYTLIGDVIDTQFLNSSRNMGATLSLVLMVLIFICMILMNQFADEDGEAVIV
ncbi:MAG: ABC transporter permease [Acutalibacteraceae bacterium]